MDNKIQKYIDELIESVREVKIPGIQSQRTELICDLVRFDVYDNCNRLGEAFCTDVTLLDALSKYNNVVVIGEPGSGKSCAIKDLLSKYDFNNNDKIPFYLRLNSLVGDNRKSVIDMLAKDKVSSIRDYVKLGKGLIVLDGLDEVFDDNLRRMIVKEILELGINNSVLLSSRPAVSNLSSFPQGKFKFAYVIPLKSNMADILVANLADVPIQQEINYKKSDDEYSYIFENPLLLSILCKLPRNSVFSNLGDLYYIFFELLFTNWINEKNLDTGNISGNWSLGVVADIFGKLCFESMNDPEKNRVLKEENLIRIIEKNIVYSGKIQDFVSYVINVTGLVKRKSNFDEIEFWHPTFYDFFVGIYLAKHFDALNKIIYEISRNVFINSQWGLSVRYALYSLKRSGNSERIKFVFSVLCNFELEDMFYSNLLFTGYLMRGDFLNSICNNVIDTIFATMLTIESDYIYEFISFIESINSGCIAWFVDKYKKELFVKEKKSDDINLLWRFANSNTINYLVEFIDAKNIYLRKRAYIALSYTGSQSLVSLMLSRFSDEEFEVRLIIIKFLGKLKEVDSVLKLLYQDDVLLKVEIIKVLGEIGNTSAIRELWNCATDKNFEIRKNAKLALCKIGEYNIFEDEEKYFDDDIEGESRCQVLSAKELSDLLEGIDRGELCKVKCNEVVDKGLIQKQCFNWMLQIYNNSKQFRSGGIGNVIKEVISDEIDFTAISEMLSSEFVNFIIDELNNDDIAINEMAFTLLSSLKFDLVVDELVIRFLNVNCSFREKILRVLSLIASNKAVESVRNALYDEDILIRSVALFELVKMGNLEAVNALKYAYFNQNFDVSREEIVSHLGFYKEPEAIDILKVALLDTDSTVRLRAADSLIEVGSMQDVAEMMLTNVNDSDVKSIISSYLKYEATCEFINTVMKRAIELNIDLFLYYPYELLGIAKKFSLKILSFSKNKEILDSYNQIEFKVMKNLNRNSASKILDEINDFLYKYQNVNNAILINTCYEQCRDTILPYFNRQFVYSQNHIREFLNVNIGQQNKSIKLIFDGEDDLFCHKNSIFNVKLCCYDAFFMISFTSSQFVLLFFFAIYYLRFNEPFMNLIPGKVDVETQDSIPESFKTLKTRINQTFQRAINNHFVLDATYGCIKWDLITVDQLSGAYLLSISQIEIKSDCYLSDKYMETIFSTNVYNDLCSLLSTSQAGRNQRDCIFDWLRYILHSTGALN